MSSAYLVVEDVLFVETAQLEDNQLAVDDRLVAEQADHSLVVEDIEDGHLVVVEVLKVLLLDIGLVLVDKTF